VAEPSSPDDLGSSWEAVREELRRDLPAQTFELWLEPLRAEALRKGDLILSAPRSTLAWVERRYGDRVRALAHERIAGVERLLFVQRGAEVGDAEAAPTAHDSLPVDSRHTFSSFVIGPGNRLAHAAALAVAELPGEAYNPLFLHGPPGLGKTHLLGAIVTYLREQQPGLAVHYTTAERFTTEFVTALRVDGPARFKERYRNVDALLIDDVEMIEGKPRTEEEFVHTFNTLHAAGKQIVLSSDRPPQALAQLAERLRDRFDWGLTVELSPPDLRTRLALLWRMVSDLPLELSEPSALAAIASQVPTNVRRLEGAMTRVAALGSLFAEPVSNSLVARALKADSTAVQVADRPAPTIAAIQEAVATAQGLRRDDLLSTSRSPRVAHARQVAMYIARDLTGASLAQIARAFGRDHSTVAYAVRAVEGRIEPGSETAGVINSARRTLGLSAGERGEIPREPVSPQSSPTTANADAKPFAPRDPRPPTA